MNDITNLPADTRSIPLETGGRPAAIIPQNVEEAFRMAQLIVKSGLAPQSLKTPEAVLATILQGAEIGLPPMMSINRIAIINGRPCIWGDAIPALVRASGLCEYIHETIEGEGDEMIAICETKRKGEPRPITDVFSVEDAKCAGLWDERPEVDRWKNDQIVGKKKNDNPWFKYPKRMLKMRARVVLRDTYADVLGGLYIREELEDVEPAAPRIEVPTPPPVPAIEHEPEPLEEPEIPAILDRREPQQEAEAAKQEADPTTVAIPNPVSEVLSGIGPAIMDGTYQQVLDDFARQIELDGDDMAARQETISEYGPRLDGADDETWAEFHKIAGM